MLLCSQLLWQDGGPIIGGHFRVSKPPWPCPHPFLTQKQLDRLQSCRESMQPLELF